MDYFALVAVVLIYLAITVYLGWLGYRHTYSSKDYYIAGGEVNPYLMAMGYGAAFISTAAIIGFSGQAAVHGMSMLWLAAFNIIVGIFVAFVWIGRRTRAMGHHLGAQTFPELMGIRYNSKFVRKFAAAVIVVAMPLYASAVMIGGARFMETTLMIDFNLSLVIVAVVVGAYVLAGGMKGVLYTGAFQGTLMLVVMIALLVFTYVKLGGIVEAHSALTAMTDMVPEELAADGHRGWTAMPEAFSPNFWFVFSTLVLGVGVGVLAQPQLAVRYMTVKSNRELYRALLPGGIFILATVAVGYIVGPLSNVYFYETMGQLSMEASVDPATNEPNVDRIMPMYITETMPIWIGYVFMLTLISAAMSTLSGLFHAIATSISYDLYQPQQADDRMRLRLARYGTIFGLIITIVISYVLPGSIIAVATAIFFGLCASSFMPPYLLGLFWKGITKSGAAAGMVVGAVLYIFIMLFVYSRMAAIFSLSGLIFGGESLVGFPYNIIDPLTYSLPVSFIVTWLVSLCTRSSLDESHIQKCFAFQKPDVSKVTFYEK